MTTEYTPNQPEDCGIGAIPSIQREDGGKPRGANRKVMRLPRMGRVSRLPWVHATGPQALRDEKAAHYLMIFNHEAARIFDQPEMTLAKVVCNLRNFYLQGAEETVNLVRSLFNPRADYRWSPEAIRLTWEMVDSFTPSLGLADEIAIAKRKAMELEREVEYLLSFTRLGGRVPTINLYILFNEWNPEMDVTDDAFGRAVVSLTGRSSTPSRGTRYYSGFVIPPQDELAEAIRLAAGSRFQQSASPLTKSDLRAA